MAMRIWCTLDSNVRGSHTMSCTALCNIRIGVNDDGRRYVFCFLFVRILLFSIRVPVVFCGVIFMISIEFPASSDTMLLFSITVPVAFVIVELYL